MARPKQLWLAIGASIAVGGIGAAGALAAAARRHKPAADDGLHEPAPTAAPQPSSIDRPAEPDGDEARSAERKRPRRAYRLGRGEPAAEGLRRIAIGRLDHALQRLEGGGTDAEAVHEARKDLKKLRAALRLLRGSLGKGRYRAENAGARDTGRMLAGARDAQVRLDTLAGLVDDGAVTEEAVDGLRFRLEEDMRLRTAADVALPAARIVEARERAREWPVEGDGWVAVAPGVRRSYRRGRARMADAIAQPSVENLHEWRKRVKDLWYHLRILSAAWPPVIDALAEEAHRLSEQLGDDHDLATLGMSARDHHDSFEDPADLDALLDAIGRRRAELQAEARGLGARIYADAPKAFDARMEAWWMAWRGGTETPLGS